MTPQKKRTPSTPRLYDDLAYLWPLISPPSDYAAEAKIIHAVLAEHDPKKSQGQSLVEFGGGGGHTLVHLANEYEVVAVDLSPTMLQQCQTLIPDIETTVGDMRDIRLDRHFDTILIHDAIDYMVTDDDVQKTLQTAATHLHPQGIALIAPTYTTETFVDHDSIEDHRENDTIQLTYTSTVTRTSDTTFDMTLKFQITRDAQTHIIEDRHTCGLFSLDQWKQSLAYAGFNVEHRETPAWSLFIATHRSV